MCWSSQISFVGIQYDDLAAIAMEDFFGLPMPILAAVGRQLLCCAKRSVYRCDHKSTIYTFLNHNIHAQTTPVKRNMQKAAKRAQIEHSSRNYSRIALYLTKAPTETSPRVMPKISFSSLSCSVSTTDSSNESFCQDGDTCDTHPGPWLVGGFT